MSWLMNDAVGYTYNLSHTSGAASMFRLKELLKYAGWTVLSSSDGLSYNSSGDQITHAGSGAGGMENNYAWFRITDPGAVREYLFQRQTNHYTWISQYSALDGFVGGSPDATTLPTAADMKGIRDAGLSTAGQIFPNGTTWYTQIAAQTSAEGDVYAFWMTCKDSGAGTGRLTLICEAIDSSEAPATDDDLAIHFLYWDNTSKIPAFDTYTAQSISSDYSSTIGFWGWARYNEANEEWGRYLAIAFAYYNSSGTLSILSGTNVLASNPESSRYPAFPIYWFRVRAATVVGYKGVGKYVRQNVRTDVASLGNVVEDDATGELYMPWGCLLLPGWADSGTMPLV